MGLRAPSVHYALARVRASRATWSPVLFQNDRIAAALRSQIAGISSLLILDAFYIGMKAVKTGGG